MLRTAALTNGQLDWASQTAARALEEPSTPTGFEIARLLLQGAEEPWEKAQVAEDAQRALNGADPALSETDEYRQLRSTLITLGFA